MIDREERPGTFFERFADRDPGEWTEIAEGRREVWRSYSDDAIYAAREVSVD
jgi:hypothetical protein